VINQKVDIKMILQCFDRPTNKTVAVAWVFVHILLVRRETMQESCTCVLRSFVPAI